MNLSRMTLALLCLCWSALTIAHTHLLESVPSNGSQLAEAPHRFVLRFAKPVHLTALNLQRGTDAAQKLGPLPAAAAAEFTLPAPPLASGAYTLSWRSVGEDGHVVPGKLQFTIR